MPYIVLNGTCLSLSQAGTPSPTKDARTPTGGTSPTGLPGGPPLPGPGAVVPPPEPARMYTESERSAVQPSALGSLASLGSLTKDEADANERNSARRTLTEPGQLGQLSFKLRCVAGVSFDLTDWSQG